MHVADMRMTQDVRFAIYLALHALNSEGTLFRTVDEYGT
jgi:hypothetical protein